MTYLKTEELIDKSSIFLFWCMAMVCLVFIFHFSFYSALPHEIASLSSTVNY